MLVPCHDEALTIATVVREFAAQRGVASVVVIDNGSTDDTAEKARAAGAQVIAESRRGKGLALWAGLFAAPGADYYVMVDGDDTYPAGDLPRLVAEARRGADMVVGSRLERREPGALRRGHGFGNQLFIVLVRVLFGLRTKDLLSGYRVLSRRFVDSIVLTSIGFEVELELSLQALQGGFTISEVAVDYRARPSGSHSKLRTVRDGSRVLAALISYFRDLRPLTFFGSLALLLWSISAVGCALVLTDFLRAVQAHRMTLAILCAGSFVLGSTAMACGVVLSAINRRTAELAALVRGRRSAP